MFSEQGVRIADAIAVEPTEVLLLNLEIYESLLREDARVAIKCKDIFEKQYKENVIANERFFTKDTTKYLALIAHNEMKPTLVNFVQRHAKIIRSFPLVATGITGILLRRLSSRHRPPLAADGTPPQKSTQLPTLCTENYPFRQMGLSLCS